MANTVWEYNVPSHVVKPTATSTTQEREFFITAKYAQKLFIDTSMVADSNVDDEFDAFVKGNKCISTLFNAVKDENLLEILRVIAAGVEVDELFTYSWEMDDPTGTGGASSHCPVQCNALHVAAFNDSLLSAVLLLQCGACVDAPLACTAKLCAALGLVDAGPNPTGDGISTTTVGRGSESGHPQVADSANSAQGQGQGQEEEIARQSLALVDLDDMLVTALTVAECLGHEEVAHYLQRRSSTNDGWKCIPSSSSNVGGVANAVNRTKWFPGKYLGFKGGNNPNKRPGSFAARPSGSFSSLQGTTASPAPTTHSANQDVTLASSSSGSNLTETQSQAQWATSASDVQTQGGDQAPDSSTKKGGGVIGRSLSVPEGSSMSMKEQQKGKEGWYFGKYVGRTRKSITPEEKDN
jgi:hypothetical protein